MAREPFDNILGANCSYHTAIVNYADIAGKHGRDSALRLYPLAILDEAHRAAAEQGKRANQLGERHVGPILALRPPEMRQ